MRASPPLDQCASRMRSFNFTHLLKLLIFKTVTKKHMDFSGEGRTVQYLTVCEQILLISWSIALKAIRRGDSKKALEESITFELSPKGQAEKEENYGRVVSDCILPVERLVGDVGTFKFVHFIIRHL